MTQRPVLAATAWPTNADLIADCAALGYLDEDWRVLDATYGRGSWWKEWRPRLLVTNDWDPRIATDCHADFRDLPFEDGEFDAVAFDPPYVSIGGRRTTGIADFHDRYGTRDAPRTPAELQQQNDDGLAEMLRVVKPGGFVLTKCQYYVSSGNVVPGVYLTVHAAFALGFELQDCLEHIAGVRPQPSRSRKDGRPVVQQHARRNCSTLLVLRAPRSRAR